MFRHVWPNFKIPNFSLSIGPVDSIICIEICLKVLEWWESYLHLYVDSLDSWHQSETNKKCHSEKSMFTHFHYTNVVYCGLCSKQKWNSNAKMPGIHWSGSRNINKCKINVNVFVDSRISPSVQQTSRPLRPVARGGQGGHLIPPHPPPPPPKKWPNSTQSQDNPRVIIKRPQIWPIWTPHPTPTKKSGYRPAPGVETLSYILSAPLVRIQHLRILLQPEPFITIQLSHSTKVFITAGWTEEAWYERLAGYRHGLQCALSTSYPSEY